MEPSIGSRNEFIQRYWKYYLLLEQQFLDTEQYLAIDKINFQAFSNEYIKQYQTICSEIDVIAKSYCLTISSDFSGKNIGDYCKYIIDDNSDFINRRVIIKDSDIRIVPWQNWTYEVNSNGRIRANNPDWWIKYNKIKHNRTTINTETGLPYYKLANQKNVLSALAALFQLELYYYRELHQNYFQNDPDMPGPQSKLFEIEEWGNFWKVYDDSLALNLM